MKKPGIARLLIRFWPTDGRFMHQKFARAGSSNQPAAVVFWTLRDVNTKLVTPAVCGVIEAAS